MSEKKVTLRWFLAPFENREVKVFLTSRPHYVVYGKTVFEREGQHEYWEALFVDEKQIKDFVIVKEPDRVELKRVPE